MAKNDAYIDDDFFFAPGKGKSAVKETEGTQSQKKAAPAKKNAASEQTAVKKTVGKKTAKKEQFRAAVAVNPRNNQPLKQFDSTQMQESPSYQMFTEDGLFSGAEANYKIGSIRASVAVTPLEDEFLKSAAFFDPAFDGKSDLIRHALRLYTKTVFKNPQLLEMIQKDLLWKGFLAKVEEE